MALEDNENQEEILPNTSAISMLPSVDESLSFSGYMGAEYVVAVGVYPEIGAVAVKDAVTIIVNGRVCGPDATKGIYWYTGTCSIASCFVKMYPGPMLGSSCTNTCNNILDRTDGTPYTFTVKRGCFAKLQTYSGAWFKWTMPDGKLSRPLIANNSLFVFSRRYKLRCGCRLHSVERSRCAECHDMVLCSR